MLKLLAGNGNIAVNPSSALDWWNNYRMLSGYHFMSYIVCWNQLWALLWSQGYHPVLHIVISVLTPWYLMGTMLGNVLLISVYYVVLEAWALICAGLTSFTTLAALIVLPLITPLAWSFLLIITFL
jgi:hypothetical protein